MSNLLQSGAAWLSDVLHAHAAETVTYRRGEASVEISAVLGQTREVTETEFGGVRLDAGSVDFLVRAADLVLDEAPVTPQAGDEILRTLSGVTYRYEVAAPGAEPVWRWTDPAHVERRIHTKLVEEG